MRPSILDDYGLDSALQTYVDDTAKYCGFPIDYQSSFRPGEERLPPWVEVTLYRVAQEAITNIVRHSRASRASVVLLRQIGNVILLIEDDGCGFDLPLPQSGHRGLGLTGMRERVNLCGGSCMIDSALKCGTTVRVKIPVGKEVSQ
jgi:signal transduction histidine kinase